jgi:hypothetical protein
MDIVVWLRSLGLGQYEAAFRENEITEKVLPSLTAEDLKSLASLLSGTAECSSTLLPLCVLTHTRPLRRPLVLRQQTRPLETPPNAAKLR